MNSTEVLLNTITFSWFDYGLFTAMIGLSVLIGLYFGCWGHQETAKEYLLGGKEMSVLPIAISLVASNISGITLLSVPTEIYRFGVTYMLYLAVLFPIFLLTYYVYLPVFFKLQLVSTYEYLMLRFDTSVRLLASGLNTINILLYLPIVVYIPALALAQATEISLHLITPVLCGICIFYTTIGGLKAVVWTDTLQFFVMMCGIFGVVYKGLESVGGFGEAWARSVRGQRLDLDFDLDPTKRDTVLATMTGTLFGGLCYMGIGQSFVQKYLSMPTRKHSKKALLLFIVGMFLIISLVTLTGLIMYARYHECDPFTARKIAKHDEILPYYVMDVASTIPGLAGLFLSGIFSAALSTLSASMNCLAGSVYEDFVSPFMPKDITQKKVSNILKLLVVIIGVISTALVFVIEQMGSIFSINYTLSGISNGPLLGLFTLGMLFPIANAKGALYGSLSTVVIMLVLITGNQVHQLSNAFQHQPKPVSILGCDNSSMIDPNIQSANKDQDEIFILFRLTYYYYGFIGTFLTVLLGLFFSYITRTSKEQIVNPDLISPVAQYVIKRFNSRRKDQNTYYSVNKAIHLVSYPETR